MHGEANGARGCIGVPEKKKVCFQLHMIERIRPERGPAWSWHITGTAHTTISALHRNPGSCTSLGESDLDKAILGPIASRANARRGQWYVHSPLHLRLHCTHSCIRVMQKASQPHIIERTGSGRASAWPCRSADEYAAGAIACLLASARAPRAQLHLCYIDDCIAGHYY